MRFRDTMRYDAVRWDMMRATTISASIHEIQQSDIIRWFAGTH